MLAIVGTIPDRDFPLVAGKVTLEKDRICIQGRRILVNRGTPALLAAAIKAGGELSQEEPFGYLVGDIGLGDGSRKLYGYLKEHLGQTDFHTLVFHYLQPDIDWHNQVLFAIDEMPKRPILIADAGFMYAAKMSGQSQAYDLFTPDIGELAFLADEEAPHPFYTRGFILHEENQVPDLIARAFKHENSARYLLVKGKHDYLASKEGIRAIIKAPLVEAMESIGGTGDTLTGMVAVLISAGMEVEQAAILAARANRLAGVYARPTPGSAVMEIIHHIPKSLGELLPEKQKKGIWAKSSPNKNVASTPK